MLGETQQRHRRSGAGQRLLRGHGLRDKRTLREPHADLAQGHAGFLGLPQNAQCTAQLKQGCGGHRASRIGAEPCKKGARSLAVVAQALERFTALQLRLGG